MNIFLKHIGKLVGDFGNTATNILEITVESSDSTLTTTVTDLNSKVDKSIIDNLREIADELEEQNERVETINN